MTFSVRPPVDHILVDYIKYKGWSHVVYIHDGANADRTLHGMFEHLNGESPGYNVYVDNFRGQASKLERKRLIIFRDKIYDEYKYIAWKPEFILLFTLNKGNRPALQAPSDEEFFREFLNDFHRRMSLSQVKKDNVSGDEGAESVRPVHVIVDLEGGYRMRMFLRALDESVLVKKEYHYVFANFEMEDADLASFHYSLINITGFQLFDRMDKKFLQNKKLFEDMYRERISTVDYLPASSAFAHDALLVAASALDRTVRKHGLSLFSSSFSRHQLFNRGLPGLYCRPHEDRDHPDRKFEPFEFGDEIAESIKERFQWAQGKGFLLGQQRVFHENRPNNTVIQKGVLVDKPWKLRLNVVTVLVKPFVMLRRSNPGDPQHKGNDRFEGYCIDLLKLLAKNISGFEYNIFVSEGNKYGARQPDGSWDGMLGYLLNETADIAVAPLTITQERERAVDFSKPFMTTGISIMIKKPEKQEFNIFSFMEPLGMRIWIFTLCSYVGVS
ncbi:hypothetical protein ANCCEY_06375 [Ancylostoma ceylanicum]|uniref:Ionotropic glutamate receptor L-glutamate and glycine-binding domain-containing protein n=1 Tax=Ancylostoma ceylanicum TaxID=53326 RepID=A0A0D6LTP7_9BILA|nr:hypothetical protein ANCCEY_06375 [Ancylostoma ceylanicum]